MTALNVVCRLSGFEVCLHDHAEGISTYLGLPTLHSIVQQLDDGEADADQATSACASGKKNSMKYCSRTSFQGLSYSDVVCVSGGT